MTGPNEMKRLRIGTRKSALAIAQTNIIAESIHRRYPTVDVELVTFVTAGDRAAGPLADIGGKGLFTEQLEQGLLSGNIDLAVHSAKDLPTDISKRFMIAAVAERADARDVLVTPGGLGLDELPAGAKIGTCSRRRGAQLLAARRDLQIVPVRGNVDTRVSKVLSGGEDVCDGVVLAMAGLGRLGLSQAHRKHMHILDFMIPASGQGAIVCETLKSADYVSSLIQALNHEVSMDALLAERSVLDGLHADCHSCIGVNVYLDEGRWRGCAMVSRSNGCDMQRVCCDGPSAGDVGRAILGMLLERGAKGILRGH